MSFHLYNLVSAPDDHVYKLVQLPPELLGYIKESDLPLQFKSPPGSKTLLVLCTKDSTYAVRQANHSNTQLLLNDMAINSLGKSLQHVLPPETADAHQLLAVGLASYTYELTKTAGHIDLTDVPVYDGVPVDAPKTVSEVLDDSPIDENAFLAQWHSLGGCEVDGKAVVLSPGFISEALFALVTLLIAQKAPTFTVAELAGRFADQSASYTEAVLRTLAGKFCSEADRAYTFDEQRVAQWFGVETLKATRGVVPDKKLLLVWKSSLPPFFSAALDLKILRGHYWRPSPGSIQYLDRALLAGDVHARVKDMFTITKEWDYDEFLPYVAEFVPATKKPDAVILKYARKRRVGKKFVVCPR